MSALGRKQISPSGEDDAALPSKQIEATQTDVRFVPIADIAFSNSMDTQAVLRDIGVAVPRGNY